MTHEREITAPVDLCLPSGLLNPDAAGWSRRPLHRCNLTGSWGRNKRWDYWCLTSDALVLSLTLADVDYLGVANLWVHDLSTDRHAEAGGMIPLARGVALPETVGGAHIEVRRRDLFLAVREEPGGSRLLADGRAKTGERIEVDVLVASPEGHETLGVVIPWSATRFQYTSKHNTRPATGVVRVGTDEHRLGGDREAWGCFDFGRGRWKYRTIWNWGSASGRSRGRVVGLQLGGKWTDGTGFTENALCVDGRLHKLADQLVWEYDLGAPLRPWMVRSPAPDRVRLTLEPVWSRFTAFQLGIAAHRGQVVFGHWSGTVKTDDGEAIEVDRLYGWGEDVRWRW